MPSAKSTLPENKNTDNHPEGCFESIENRETVHQRFPFWHPFDNPSFTCLIRAWIFVLIHACVESGKIVIQTRPSSVTDGVGPRIDVTNSKTPTFQLRHEVCS